MAWIPLSTFYKRFPRFMFRWTTNIPEESIVPRLVRKMDSTRFLKKKWWYYWTWFFFKGRISPLLFKHTTYSWAKKATPPSNRSRPNMNFQVKGVPWTGQWSITSAKGPAKWNFYIIKRWVLLWTSLLEFKPQASHRRMEDTVMWGPKPNRPTPTRCLITRGLCCPLYISVWNGAQEPKS